MNSHIIGMLRVNLAIFCARPIASSQFLLFLWQRETFQRWNLLINLTENISRVLQLKMPLTVVFTDLCQKYNNNDMLVRETSNGIWRTENVLYLVLTERIVRSCLFNATFISISYHVFEISVKFRCSLISLKYHNEIHNNAFFFIE